MRLKYIASLTATIAIMTHPAIAQETKESQSSLPKPLVNTNISDQSTINFVFNNRYTSLSLPCNYQICLFTLIRNSSQEIEFLGGVVWQLGGSHEDTKAETEKFRAIAEKEKIDQETTLTLTDKLADAIESNKIERVKLYAITLAKRLGYADYHELLKEIITPIELLKY
ncbi:hypothetical protein FJR11_09785 [Anabaena sp. UHCC 0187]|uniref:hypothetical protein n=1 Tax=Anabaena sp. UHCC 0187 TaxID=2590018 RepID=UPI001446650D|nr:hypothetical protein [Anabaena sp. UHCC 0187]MDP5015892.1 hypothetical protein [Dolichospermum sp.]MTJ12875.1 hypothetical protein [Anabaena sp. UHCC 0187]